MSGLHTRSRTISIKTREADGEKNQTFSLLPRCVCQQKKIFSAILKFSSFFSLYKTIFLFLLFSRAPQKWLFYNKKYFISLELSRPRSERALRHFNPFCPKSNKVLRNRNERRKKLYNCCLNTAKCTTDYACIFSVKYFCLIHLIVVFVSVFISFSSSFFGSPPSSFFTISRCLKLYLFPCTRSRSLLPIPSSSFSSLSHRPKHIKYLLLSHGHKINFISVLFSAHIYM